MAITEKTRYGVVAAQNGPGAFRVDFTDVYGPGCEWLTAAQIRSAKVGDKVEVAYRSSAGRGQWVVSQIFATVDDARGEALRPEVRTVSTRIEGGGQTVEYVEHLRIAVTAADVLEKGDGRTTHTIRIRIHSDDHPGNAYAVVERWDGTRWNEIATISGPALKGPHVGYTIKGMTAARAADAFRDDRQVLIDLATEVLAS